MLLSNVMKGSMCFREGFKTKVKQTKEKEKKKKKQCIFSKSVVAVHVHFLKKKKKVKMLWYLSDLARYIQLYHQKAPKRTKVPSFYFTS